MIRPIYLNQSFDQSPFYFLSLFSSPLTHPYKIVARSLKGLRIRHDREFANLAIDALRRSPTTMNL